MGCGNEWNFLSNDFEKPKAVDYIARTDEDWTIVEIKPAQVDFLTALNEWNKGKTICCILNNAKYTFEHELAETWREKMDVRFETDKILNGKWYVKD